MQKILFILLLAVSTVAKAQILPKEWSNLNYRIVGFSMPPDPAAKRYTLEVAKGNCTTEKEFAASLVVSKVGTSNKIVAEVPAFDTKYTWRMIYSSSAGIIKTSKFSHFSTGRSNAVDTSIYRLRVMDKAAEKYNDHYVTVDLSGTIYDLQGNAVWYFPDTAYRRVSLVDMKVTPEGTITFLCGLPYEADFNGTTLWKGDDGSLPGNKGKPSKMFHHEFAKLPNGHYMALEMDMKLVMCRPVVSGNSTSIEISPSATPIPGYTPGRFSSLVEYDKAGNVIWSWKSIDHLLGTDYDYFNPADTNIRFDPHDNAFAFDEKNKAIYLSFRNLNRIIKIDYPGGKISRIYGENFKPDSPQTGQDIFCNQHCIRLSAKGDLYFYNNNSCKMRDSLPQIIMLKQPATPFGKLEKVWQYTCTADTLHRKIFASAGSVMELPDGGIYACMAGDYSKLFIVSHDKKVQWSALWEERNIHEKKWSAPKQDRSVLIDRPTLEKMIWKAEEAK